MNKLKYLFVLSLFILPSLTFAQMKGLSEFTLDNGLEVLIGENHKAPIVKVMLIYKVGAADEKAGKSGLAHLLEHLMFRGTVNVPKTRFNEITLENGFDSNAFTSRYITLYHELTDVSRLELVLALEADRMQNIKIDDEAFKAEQKIVYQERQQRVENKPKARFAEDMNRIFWQNTPYEHPVSGTLSEIEALTKDDALAFYETYYTPENAVLVIVGDVMPAEIMPIVQKYFGHIQKGEKPKRDFHFNVSDQGSYFASKRMPDEEKKVISVSYIVPSAHQNRRLAYALYVFSSYFGESGVHYLKKNLVNTQKVVSASSGLNILSRGAGEFEISVLPNRGSKIDDNLKMINQALEDASLSFTPELLEKEKKKILSWFVYIQDNPSDLAYFIGQLKVLGWRLDEIENYTSNIENVTIEDVKEALLLLKNTKKMTTVLMPDKKRKKQVLDDNAAPKEVQYGL